MLRLVYRIGAGDPVYGCLEAYASDQEQVDQQDGDENKSADYDVKGAKAQDALFSVVGTIGWRNVIFAVMVAVIGFGHGSKVVLRSVMGAKKEYLIAHDEGEAICISVEMQTGGAGEHFA
jgi:hypothetical protein